MLGSGSQSPFDASAYDVIEAAVAETERGRRFLAEFARRHRGADTDTLLQAIARLESVVTRDAAVLTPPDAVRETLAAMAGSIARTRDDIANMTLPDGHESPAAPATLDTLVQGAERATSEILGAAEAMQEAAWSLREKGADTGLCDVLDRHAIAIYTACSLQDLSAQRTGRAIATLRELETRIAALLGREAPPVAEPPSATPPPLPDALPEADELDFAPAEPEAEPPPAGPQPRKVTAEAGGGDDLALAFADLDSLSIEEKIALFS
ncbi:hypothetical protein [Methylobacterium haplocladii]|uniref:Chemotaxis protein CheZ n=1 Tax=Methylobacterium haplocladii TaxID=1176176 RepID=A0A512IQQ3_9HYPH|nr:hypothetical protein [Methylobacterium haplocladii]GEP00006.1 hypothetical protein MHA02_23930 [Methylobacterium haplocladii]GJD85722.1 hypothetical protein HPGCJGGD_3613 [Methylobacterium haplocladii]